MSQRHGLFPTKSNRKDGMGRWLTRLKSWITMSEPSVQAFKQHRRDTYKNVGVALNDPRASAKLQCVSKHLCFLLLPSS